MGSSTLEVQEVVSDLETVPFMSTQELSVETEVIASLRAELAQEKLVISGLRTEIDVLTKEKNSLKLRRGEDREFIMHKAREVEEVRQAYEVARTSLETWCKQALENRDLMHKLERETWSNRRHDLQKELKAFRRRLRPHLRRLILFFLRLS